MSAGAGPVRRIGLLGGTALAAVAASVILSTAAGAEASRGAALPPGWTAWGEPRPAGAGRADSPGGLSPRIVGGTTTAASEWPWQVALVLDHDFFPGNDFDRQFCGGSVLTPDLILTAAHCFFDTGFTPRETEVLTGRTQLTAGGGQRFDAQNVFLFGYNPATAENDIALVDLYPARTASPRILLPGPEERTLWDTVRPVADGAYITGWGQTSERGDFADVLREAFVRIIADSTCGSPGIYGDVFLPSVMVCAGFLGGGVDSCIGDSGGPLSVAARFGQWRQAGVVSFGEGCARPNKPGVYSRVGADPLRDVLQDAVNSLNADVGAPPLSIIGSGGAFPCNPTIFGTEGRDVLNGTRFADVIAGLGGADKIRGGRGADLLCGDKGADTLFGGRGRDSLFGAKGRDRLLGGGGKDRLRGQKGRDRLFGGKGKDSLKGGPGRDVLVR
jgi:secreted trypsin-like serine protease